MGRTAIFGGAFNPPTAAHAEIIKTLVDRGEYDLVIIAPSYAPPHKEKSDLIDMSERMEMLQAMVEAMHSENTLTSVVLADIEETVFEQTGGYTYNLLKIFQENLGDEIDFVVGEDQLHKFTTWKDYEKLIEEFKLIVFTRGSGAFAFPEGLDISKAKEMPLVLRKKYESMSSSQIREALAEDKPTDGLPACVETIIRKRGWYGAMPGM